MSKHIILTVSATTFMIVGCHIENDDWLDTSESEMALEQTGAADEDSQSALGWSEIAPGVWERKRPDGGSERLGFGAEGFEFALDHAQRERTLMLRTVESSRQTALSRRLRANGELIAYLEDSLEKLGNSDMLEPLPVAPATDGFQTAGMSSGSVCAGYYGFDISFFLGMAGGSVSARAEWSEFGPFAPYKKTLHTYAYAAHEAYGELYVTHDSDQYGPFSGSCCVSVESSATAYPTFAPQLYGSTYLAVTNGCSAARFYEASYP